MHYHRLFIALPVSPDLQNKIQAWQENWANLPVRWLTPEQLHITVVPPWQEKNIDEVKQVLAALKAEAKPLKLQFQTIGLGPRPAEPRLLWATGTTPPELVALKDILEKTLGLTPQHRSFNLHLTLARFQPQEFSRFPVHHLEEHVDWQNSAASFSLIESFLRPDGVEYETLATYSL